MAAFPASGHHHPRTRETQARFSRKGTSYGGVGHLRSVGCAPVECVDGLFAVFGYLVIVLSLGVSGETFMQIGAGRNGAVECPYMRVSTRSFNRASQSL